MDGYRGYVGLDVCRDTIAVAVAWPDREEPEYRGVIPNRRSSHQRLVRRLQGEHRGAVSFAYEAAPCGYGVYREIIEAAHDCRL